MDTIASTWTASQRIGQSVPAYEAERYAAIEEKVQSLCSRYGLVGKFNVGLKTGGIPPIGDRSPIVNPTVTEIGYYDMLGGVMVATRNAEVNCRLIDYIMTRPEVDDELIQSLLDSVRDKYVLTDEAPWVNLQVAQAVLDVYVQVASGEEGATFPTNWLDFRFEIATAPDPQAITHSQDFRLDVYGGY